MAAFYDGANNFMVKTSTCRSRNEEWLGRLKHYVVDYSSHLIDSVASRFFISCRRRFNPHHPGGRSCSGSDQAADRCSPLEALEREGRNSCIMGGTASVPSHFFFFRAHE
jgi:hypothetical protein